MAYDNLTNVTTSKSGTWNTGTGEFIYGDVISLESGIPHKDQLEVERIFALPTSPDVASKITVFDLHRIFIVYKDDYQVNEAASNGKIISLTPSNPTTRNYTLTGGDLVGTVVTIPVIANGQAITVRRKTFSSGKYVTWSAGTRLTSEQLNLQVNQLIKLNQELIYKLESEYLKSSDVTGSSAPAFGVNNDLDMNGNKIVDLGLASSGTDAVSVDYANANYLMIGGSVAQSVTGAKTFSGAALFQNTVTADSTLLVTGMTTLNGGLTMDTNKFTVADTTGNTGIGGTLNVTGAAVLSSTLSAGATTLASASVTGALTVDTTTLVVDAVNNRVGIGTATPAVDLQVVASANPIIVSEATANTGVSQVRAVSDGAAIDLRSYGTTAAGSLSGLARADMTAVYAATPTNLLIATSTAAPISFATNDVVRVTVPSNASGIQFPSSPTVSADANTLDAYVEGTHTILATHIQGSGTAGTFTLDNTNAADNKLTYTRVGNRVFFECSLKFAGAPSGSPTGALQVTTLPFTAGANAGATFNCEFNTISGTTIYLLGLWSPSTSTITFRTVSGTPLASTSQFAPNQVTTNTVIKFSGHIAL